MSRKLDRERSEANALRTLDERRAAQAAQERNNAARSAPAGSYADDRRAPPQGNGNGYGYGYGQAPAPAQPPVIVQQNGGSGLGHIVAGAILARSMSNAHANNNNNGANNNGSTGSNGGYYPAPGGSAGDLANQAGAGSVGAGTAAAPASAEPATGQARPAAPASKGSVLGTIVWLCVLALVVWGVWRVLKRRKARREADKPNYSFERN
jgi:uncharacterized protein YgiB involved in biofilm formation